MTDAIVKFQKPSLTFPRCEIKPTGLVFDPGIPFDEWQAIGESLRQIGNSRLWWWGDWCNYGEAAYGEKYSQALEASNYEYDTLEHAAGVAKHIKIGRRRPNLSFSCHREVVVLEEERKQDEWLDRAEKEGLTHKELRRLIRESKIEPLARLAASAIIYPEDALLFLAQRVQDESADLLLTDPPYMTAIKDIEGFSAEWVPLALAKIKDTGRAYIFTGAYPHEIQAYLKVLLGQSRFTLDNILVWTYRNTLGPAPAMGYKLNWQACFHLYGPKAVALDCPIMTEQFTVQDINAPDGRLGDRYHTWQKPDEIADRFIKHSTKPGALVIDPFAGTGTFLLAAARYGRISIGAEIDDQILTIAKDRGIRVSQ